MASASTCIARASSARLRADHLRETSTNIAATHATPAITSSHNSAFTPRL